VRFLAPRRLALAAVALAALAAPAAAQARPDQRVGHIVVIYQENHSFDNLYGRWERVRGVSDAPPARTIQVNQQGAAYTCLRRRARPSPVTSATPRS
jgi:phospholipase C